MVLDEHCYCHPWATLCAGVADEPAIVQASFGLGESILATDVVPIDRALVPVPLVTTSSNMVRRSAASTAGICASSS